MHRLRGLLAAALPLIILPALARPASAFVQKLEHAGGLVSYSGSGGEVSITWERPPPARPWLAGAPLFSGRLPRGPNGPHEGTAFMLRKGCPPVAYRVRGAWRKGRLVLKGAAPLRAKGCAVRGFSPRAPGAVLVFRPWRPPAATGPDPFMESIRKRTMPGAEGVHRQAVPGGVIFWSLRRTAQRVKPVEVALRISCASGREKVRLLRGCALVSARPGPGGVRLHMREFDFRSRSCSIDRRYYLTGRCRP